MVSRTNKFRGRCRTHGRGHKAGRGAGKRGGRGNAGLNKHKVMTRIKYMPNHWGMHGFNRKPSLRTVNVCCNVSDLEKMEADGENFWNIVMYYCNYDVKFDNIFSKLLTSSKSLDFFNLDTRNESDVIK